MVSHAPALTALKRHIRMLPRRTTFVPAAIGASMILLVVLIWAFMPTAQNNDFETKVKSDLANLAARLEGHIATRLTIGEQLRHSLAVGQFTSRQDFLNHTTYIHRLFTDFQAINWIDSMGVIRWVSPLKGNEQVQNLDVRNHSFVGPTFRQAEKLKRMQITPPFALTQGGIGFVAYVPVVRMERITGFVNIVFRSDPLVRTALQDGLLDKYQLVIMDSKRLVFSSQDGLTADETLYHEHIRVGNREWTINLMPTPTTIAAHSSLIDELVLTILILLSIAIAWLAHLAMVRQLKVMVSDKLLRTFIENSPSAIVIKDAKYRYLHANSKWHEWFNPKGIDVKGLTSTDVFPPGYAAEVDRQQRQIMTHRHMVEQEYLSPRVDGKKVPTFVQMFPIMDDQGDVIAIGGTLTDISANKRTEEALRKAVAKAEEASQAKSKFLATMSHELRTPLNAIIGFSDILMGQYFGPVGNVKYIEYAKDINHSGRHLLALINEVLDISAIELGKRELQPEPLRLQYLLADCVKAIRYRAESQGIMVALITAPELPEIIADKTAMQQVFLNLLTNAVKFSRTGDKITVTARCRDSGIVVTVADTGEGIRKEQLPLITEPFVKGHSSSDITHEGVGLGLSIVKSFVAAHHGTLQIDSSYGVGTTVTVTLPMAKSLMVA